MDKFKVAVTGDVGEDVYTKDTPGFISDEDFRQEIVYDLEVPSGAGLHLNALKCLLDKRAFDVADCSPTLSTLAQSLQCLDQYRWDGDSVIRIKRAAPLIKRASSPKGKPTVTDQVMTQAADADCLVIHDATPSWRESEKAGQLVTRFFAGKRQSNDRSVFVILGDRIPDLHIDADTKTATVSGKHSPVWTALYKHREHVAVFCSVTSLRRAGAAISLRQSWEQAVEDTFEDLKFFPPLRSLSEFGHLILRLGFVGALHFQRTGQQAKQLIFAPNARNAIFRDEEEDGQILGRTSAMVACLLQQIQRIEHGTKSSSSLKPDEAASAIKTGLTASMRLFDLGFRWPSDNSYPNKGRLGKDFLRSYYCANGSKLVPKEIVEKGYDRLMKDGLIPQNRILGTVDLSNHAHQQKPWRHLQSHINEQQMSRINLGIALCRFGHQEVFNRPLEEDQESPKKIWSIRTEEIRKVLEKPECLLSKEETPDDKPLEPNMSVASPRRTDYRPLQPHAKSLYVPVLEFGDLVAIERHEIESFRSIRNLMALYLQSHGQAHMSHPISIAVFGSPGSGKSFAIKQIAKSLNLPDPDASDRFETIECNVAQFRSVEDLGHVITRIASVNIERKTPLVFFDEFDCVFETEPLG